MCSRHYKPLVLTWQDFYSGLVVCTNGTTRACHVGLKVAALDDSLGIAQHVKGTPKPALVACECAVHYGDAPVTFGCYGAAQEIICLVLQELARLHQDAAIFQVYPAGKSWWVHFVIADAAAIQEHTGVTVIGC
jgi:hypothetical protein